MWPCAKAWPEPPRTAHSYPIEPPTGEDEPPIATQRFMICDWSKRTHVDRRPSSSRSWSPVTSLVAVVPVTRTLVTRPPQVPYPFRDSTVISLIAPTPSLASAVARFTDTVQDA